MNAQVKDAGSKSSVKELIIDEREIERRRQFVDFQPEDIKRVQAVQDIITKHADELTKRFFDRLLSFPEAKGLFAPSVLEEAKRLKKDHLVAMAAGEYGAYYVDQRLKLGRLYGRAGLESKVFLGAFHSFMQMAGEKIMSEFKGTPQEAFQSFLALKKIAFFDLGLIVDSIVFDREQTIRRQQEAIRELSTPVLQLRDRLLILPIVGMIDTYRAKLLTENLLRAIRANRAKVVVIDITGVAAVDSKVANHLVQTVAASKLMGAHVIVTGLSADVAMALVALGIELSKLNTVGDLQGGIEEAEKILNFHLMARDGHSTWFGASSLNSKSNGRSGSVGLGE